LHLKNINESEFENVIKVHINKLLYPLIKQLKESGQTGILSNDSLIDMYSLILKFHLQENKDLMTQFKNDILKGFVIDSNNEKEKLINWLVRCSTSFENFPIDFFILPVVACLNASIKSLQETAKNFLITNYILKKDEDEKDNYKKKVKEECEKLKIKSNIYEEIFEKMNSPRVYDNTNKSMINSKNIIPLSSIFAIPGTIPSYPTPKKIEILIMKLVLFVNHLLEKKLKKIGI
jgi:hypothetical protein